MSFCKVNYVNVISHTSSVRSIIIISEYPKFFQFTYCNLCDIWHQVVRDSVWILSDGSALVSTDRIKVTEKNYVPFRICFLNVCQNLLKHGLCPSVWVCALSFRALFCDRDDCRISVYSCRWREDNVLYIMFSHNIYQC